MLFAFPLFYIVSFCYADILCGHPGDGFSNVVMLGLSHCLILYHFVVQTYCADTQVTDSAASSTAYQCGVKTNKGLLGLDPRVSRLDCQASLRPDMQLTSILDWSLAAGTVITEHFSGITSTSHLVKVEKSCSLLKCMLFAHICMWTRWYFGFAGDKIDIDKCTFLPGLE